MISFDNVTKTYRTKNCSITAVKDASFDIEEGEFVCIVGKSGAGKTTLIKLLTGCEKPSKGKIIFKGTDIGRISSNELQKTRRKIGVVFQDYKLLETRTVTENLSYIMEIIGISDTSINRDVNHVLEIVGLEQRAHNFPCDLSGGEKQRLAIARALIHRPDVIIADEPTGNLDLYNSYDIINLFKKINGLGATIVLATHDKDVIGKLKKRVITIDEGRIVSDDPHGRFIL
ncbi:MAG: ATP-binding cassette domain-containing protein [Parcubacteria group bacterium]|nr:ATP-binding cassette domain-containing protein [Parcubacteria group bacterium]